MHYRCLKRFVVENVQLFRFSARRGKQRPGTFLNRTFLKHNFLRQIDSRVLPLMMTTPTSIEQWVSVLKEHSVSWKLALVKMQEPGARKLDRRLCGEVASLSLLTLRGASDPFGLRISTFRWPSGLSTESTMSTISSVWLGFNRITWWGAEDEEVAEGGAEEGAGRCGSKIDTEGVVSGKVRVTPERKGFSLQFWQHCHSIIMVHGEKSSKATKSCSRWPFYAKIFTFFDTFFELFVWLLFKTFKNIYKIRLWIVWTVFNPLIKLPDTV